MGSAQTTCDFFAKCAWKTTCLKKAELGIHHPWDNSVDFCGSNSSSYNKICSPQMIVIGNDTLVNIAWPLHLQLLDKTISHILLIKFCIRRIIVSMMQWIQKTPLIASQHPLLLLTSSGEQQNREAKKNSCIHSQLLLPRRRRRFKKDVECSAVVKIFGYTLIRVCLQFILCKSLGKDRFYQGLGISENWSCGKFLDHSQLLGKTC